jgi:hypothetical protein
VDEEAVFGKGYYRLKMVDSNGSSYSYSNTIAIQLNLDGLVQHYPIPLQKSAIYIQLNALIFGNNLRSIDNFRILSLP